jgi:hypothetical protein
MIADCKTKSEIAYSLTLVRMCVHDRNVASGVRNVVSRTSQSDSPSTPTENVMP